MSEQGSMNSFLDDLASAAPTPGGGGAAAVMGAMGSALVSMVCNLTIGKKKYEDVESDMRAALEKAEALRAKLQVMVKEDVRVFDQVMAAYGLPKESDEQKADRTTAIQAALKEATDVPIACAELCADVIALSRDVAEKGNRNVISDAGVAVMGAYAALKSAALNVDINVGSIKDEAFCTDRAERIKTLTQNADKDVTEIYAIVKNRL